MSKRTKKIEKLRKGHIWPSIISLFVSLFMAVIACIAFMGLIMTYFAQDRMEAAYDDVMNIAQMFMADTEEGEDAKLFAYLERTSDKGDAVYLLSKDGQVINGFGGQTYDLEYSAELLSHSGCKLYMDSNAKYLKKQIDIGGVVKVVDAGDMDTLIDMEALLRDVIIENDIVQWIRKMDRTGYDRKQVVVGDSFWIGIPLAEDRTLLVKSGLDFYVSDFMLAIALAAVSAVFMMFPVVFLFFNALANFKNQHRVTKLLYTDPVTSGNNWMYFEHSVGKILKKKKNMKFAIVDITMMKYRGYCTCHGVTAGEELLEKIDRQLFYATKGGEYVAHSEKSSFALLLKYSDRDSCTKRVDEIIGKLSTSVENHGALPFHAGIYFVEPMNEEEKKRSRKHGVDISEYYNRASAARATIADENQTATVVFDQKLLEEQLWEHKVEEKMQEALDHEEFHVYIQPKYNPVNDKLAGAEALVRWINEEDGFIAPGRFIPIFEKNGFITKLDDYMISHVAKLQADWLAAGKDIVPVSVNVSRAHFADPDLAEHICALVDAYQLPHHYLEIELTESAFFDDKEALLKTVRKLKEAGFDISMDDFGAGYSSLNSLKDLPLDVLKLDAEFFRGKEAIHGENGGKRGEIVVAEAINLAKKLNMRIVAEGVEEKDQVDFLATQDCDMIQGYFYAKPMPAEEYENRLQKANQAKEENISEEKISESSEPEDKASESSKPEDKASEESAEEDKK